MELLDVTLREGEQRAGHSYTVDQKVEAVRHLDDLGIEYVQIGFPVADDRTARVCNRVTVDAKTAGIARVIERDVEAAIESGVDVVELFAPTSDRQREHIIGLSWSELVDRVESTVTLARDSDLDVHFTAMDGFRSDPAKLANLFGSLDVEYVSIADTVGVRTPREVGEFLDDLDLDLNRVGVHFHDDLGMATANALVAADCGVGKVDVSVAGVGERVGNTPLEEFAAAGALGTESVDLNLNLDRLVPLTSAVLGALDEEISPEKAILGAAAFEHESGLHTAAMLDDSATFEPFDPTQFGGERRLLFGQASGRGAARRLLERADLEPTDERISTLLNWLANGEERTLDEAIELAQSIE